MSLFPAVLFALRAQWHEDYATLGGVYTAATMVYGFGALGVGLAIGRVRALTFLRICVRGRGGGRPGGRRRAHPRRLLGGALRPRRLVLPLPHRRGHARLDGQRQRPRLPRPPRHDRQHRPHRGAGVRRHPRLARLVAPAVRARGRLRRRPGRGAARRAAESRRPASPKPQPAPAEQPTPEVAPRPRPPDTATDAPTSRRSSTSTRSRSRSASSSAAWSPSCPRTPACAPTSCPRVRSCAGASSRRSSTPSASSANGPAATSAPGGAQSASTCCFWGCRQRSSRSPSSPGTGRYCCSS